MTAPSQADRANVGMMLMVHRAFERDAARLQAAVSEAPTDPSRIQAIWQNWDLFHSLLEHHHQAEDQALWPTLVEAFAGADEVVERMASQHEALDDLLSSTHADMRLWAEDPKPELAQSGVDGIRAIADILGSHLAEEEREALPLVEEHMSALQWSVFTNRNGELNADIVWTMPWLTEGKPDQARAMIWSFVPDEVRSGPAREWSSSYAAMVSAAFGGEPPVVGPPVG